MIKFKYSSRRYFKTLSNLILNTTVISNQHLTPEISLRLITPSCHLYQSSEPHPFKNDPFWAFYWPGGQALARYILDNPKIVVNMAVLDVGSGSGACAIAAAKSGAKFVTANDIDEVALTAIRINADLNDVKLDVVSEDLIGSDCKKYDCILFGDVFYDSDFAAKLEPWLKHLSQAGKSVIVGDPGRHDLTKNRKSFLKLLMKYKLPENCCIENNGFTHGYVWKYV